MSVNMSVVMAVAFCVALAVAGWLSGFGPKGLQSAGFGGGATTQSSGW